MSEITEAMVDAYLTAQRKTVEEADQFGRPNIGGLHTNTVRAATRNGLAAALAAAPAQPVVAILFEHEDGRYAVNPDTTGDPAWHRIGPVDISALAATAQPATPQAADSVLEDAARYQMVRRGQHWSVVDGIGDHLRGEALDAAVDAARKQGANHD